MMSSSVLFVQIARALYGVPDKSGWQKQFAEDAGISIRQVRRIVAGDLEPSARAWRALVDVARRRASTVASAAAEAEDLAGGGKSP